MKRKKKENVVRLWPLYIRIIFSGIVIFVILRSPSQYISLLRVFTKCIISNNVCMIQYAKKGIKENSIEAVKKGSIDQRKKGEIHLRRRKKIIIYYYSIILILIANFLLFILISSLL